MSGFEPRSGISLYGAEDRPLVLDRQIGKGGEGSVWSVAGDCSIVAKFYHAGLGLEQARKLEAMCQLKSESLLRVAAWPTAMLKTSRFGRAEGLLMPRIDGYKEAHLLYTPKSRRVSFPEAQFPFIVHASANVARAFSTVHTAGQVIGDVNHGNLLISRDARVALIDCDSFEINTGSAWFPCLVGVPTYTPPELQGQSFAGIRRTRQHDAFGLAVLIFHMLFLGRHPFSGIFRQGAADKTVEDAIREYRFAYLPDNRLTEMDPPLAIPQLAEFPADIGQLFVRAFTRGSTRPAANEWIAALENLLRNLKPCAANSSHHFFKPRSECPWCRVEKAFGRPMFGIKFSIVRGPDFDLISVWAQIELIQPDTQTLVPPNPNTYHDQCQKNAGIPQLKAKRNQKRLFGVGTILLAVIVVISGQLPAVLAIVVLMAGLYGLSYFWRTGNMSCDTAFKAAKQEAVNSFNEGLRRWNGLERPPAEFLSNKQKLQEARDEFAGLAGMRAQKIATLRAQLWQKQQTRFLEQFLIEEATIPGIGQGRKNLLRCYGIEDASDVENSRLCIKGFGPSLKASLLSWRIMKEREFIFNPHEEIDPSELRVLDQELAQKRLALINTLVSGPNRLRHVLLPWEVQRSGLIANLEHWARKIAQAEVDLAAIERS
jgi:DNA-binding helix-hairpin-helix protein with protein kinase domain